LRESGVLAAVLRRPAAVPGYTEAGQPQNQGPVEMKLPMLGGIAILTAIVTAPAAAQSGQFSIQPYVAYGFFGDLPETEITLEGAPTFGARAAYHFDPQWAVFGNFQRSTPAMTRESTDIDLGELNVDHWSAGVEFSYIPRGGAEGMIPLNFEAGLGQARYESDVSSFAVNLGIGSGLRLTDNFAIRYGANDYISNYNDDGIVNQLFVNVGVELIF
jgi:hypothetical protein